MKTETSKQAGRQVGRQAGRQVAGGGGWGVERQAEIESM